MSTSRRRFIKNTVLTSAGMAMIPQKGLKGFHSDFIPTASPFFVNFSAASLRVIEGNNSAILTASSVLQNVIAERTRIQLPIIQNKLKDDKPLIVLSTDREVSNFPPNYQTALGRLVSPGDEGYRIIFLKDQQTILIVGHDERGALFGVGYLLRKMELRQQEILVPEELFISSTPAYAIRGHQLGYRPKTNAYDAWTVDQFDRYIRDLVLFGANSIEIMPPHTDDNFSNQHMKLPAIKMIAEQSRICEKYGLDLWMWYPNMGNDYVGTDSIQKELEARARVFGALPKLDHLFVPGGDPGDLKPEVLFNWLKKVAMILHKYHPTAKIWVSPQVFKPTKQWYNHFFKEVNKGYSWLGGVVYGPWIKKSIREVRKQVRKDLPIRRYPDITHSLMCQYPVAGWDLAFAMTLGRECYNPRPFAEKHIQNVFAKEGNGSISYSEGINDDVNKFVWTGQDWDPESSVVETLRDYARLFVSPDYTDALTEGIIALEENFKGSLIANERVPQTLRQWKDMESQATSEVLGNYRFQMCLLRAYYDAYIQRRLIYETELEQEAKDILATAGRIGSLRAIQWAKHILKKATENPVRQDLRNRCFELSDAVYKSIGSQLTVKQPQAAKPGRGNFMDQIDLPLNDSSWLLSQFEKSEKMGNEKLRLQSIHDLLNRQDPGPGGFYDNLGTLFLTWRRIIRQKTWSEDPGGLDAPFVDFGTNLQGEEEWVDILPVGFKDQAVPHAWMTTITTAYDTPFKMYYDRLNPQSSYSIRIAYTGRFDSHIKLVAGNQYTIHDYFLIGEKPIYEFPIPTAAYADGNLELTWSCMHGERGTQVAEVWIIKK